MGSLNSFASLPCMGSLCKPHSLQEDAISKATTSEGFLCIPEKAPWNFPHPGCSQLGSMALHAQLATGGLPDCSGKTAGAREEAGGNSHLNPHFNPCPAHSQTHN